FFKHFGSAFVLPAGADREGNDVSSTMSTFLHRIFPREMFWMPEIGNRCQFDLKSLPDKEKNATRKRLSSQHLWLKGLFCTRLGGGHRLCSDGSLTNCFKHCRLR